MNLIKKTETILGLWPPDHGETEIEALKSRLFQQSGQAAFRALPGFIPLAAGAELEKRFHREDRHLPASPVVTLGPLVNYAEHLFLQVCPWDSVADFMKQLPGSASAKKPGLVPLAQGLYLGPMTKELDLEKIKGPCIKISRFSLIAIEMAYQEPRPWEHPLLWEIIFDKPLKRPV